MSQNGKQKASIEALLSGRELGRFYRELREAEAILKERGFKDNSRTKPLTAELARICGYAQPTTMSSVRSKRNSPSMGRLKSLENWLAVNRPEVTEATVQVTETLQARGPVVAENGPISPETLSPIEAASYEIEGCRKGLDKLIERMEGAVNQLPRFLRGEAINILEELRMVREDWTKKAEPLALTAGKAE